MKALNFELKDYEISKLKSFAIPPQNYWQERSGLKWN